MNEPRSLCTLYWFVTVKKSPSQNAYAFACMALQNVLRGNVGDAWHKCQLVGYPNRKCVS